MKRSLKPYNSFPRQAIVLAAGLGTRLRPLTHQIPKPALPVGGIPILIYNLFLLKSAGIKNITINLHHLPRRLKDILNVSKKLGIRLQYSHEKSILGTAGGIAQALRKMGSGTTFVLNGDIVSDLDLKRMFSLHRKNKALATLACVPTDRAKVHSYVEFNRQGKIYRIAGQPKRKTPVLNKGIFTGAHLIEPELFTGYPAHAFGCIVRNVYQPALHNGQMLQAYRHPGNWWDLGNLEELKRIDQLFWQKKAPKPMMDFWQNVYDWSDPLFNNP